MSELTGNSPATLDGVRVWVVTDGTAEAGGWLEPLVDALRSVGAATVDVLGVSGVLGMTARGLLGQGADKIARTLRLTRVGEPDAPAIEAMRSGRPDVVIVDHPGILRTLEIIRDTTGVEAVHVAVVTSPGEGLWVAARADAFIAQDPELLSRVRRPRMAEAALQVAGPPLPAGWERVLDRDALRAELGLGDARVVLVDTSTMEPELIDRLVLHLAAVGGALRPIFYYGRNRASADALRQGAAVHGVRADMFGHVDAYEEYAVTADLVVVGPDNAFVDAYLALDRPVVALDPALADRHVARSGAVVVAPDASVVGDVLQRVATSGVAEAHSEAARSAIGPRPTEAVASAVARVWAARAALRASDVVIGPAGMSGRQLSRSGRFEQIGGDGSVSRTLEPLSRAAAKEQLATLILEERRVEAEIATEARGRDQWFERVALAEDDGDVELASFASERARASTRTIASLNERLGAIQVQKDVIRRRAAVGRSGVAPRDAPTPEGSGVEEYEERFRRLERERDIRRLRAKAGEREP